MIAPMSKKEERIERAEAICALASVALEAINKLSEHIEQMHPNWKPVWAVKPFRPKRKRKTKAKK